MNIKIGEYMDGIKCLFDKFWQQKKRTDIWKKHTILLD